MKLSSLALMAVAATPISMVSASDSVRRQLVLEEYASIFELLEAECAEPTPAPAKSKGAKGDARRQLQTKSSGKGSKSSGSNCEGKWLASSAFPATPAANPLLGLVFDACFLTGTTNPMVTDAIGTLAPTTIPPTSFKLDLAEDELFSYPVRITFEGDVVDPTYIDTVKADCGYELPQLVPNLPGATPALGYGIAVTTGALPSTITSAIFPADGIRDFGGMRKDWGVFYVYACDGEFDDSDISAPVADFAEAYKAGGCPDDDDESGKKGDRL